MNRFSLIFILIIFLTIDCKNGSSEPKQVASTLQINEENSETETKSQTDEEAKLSKALALAEKPDQCHIVTGLLFELIKSSNPKVSQTSRYQLGTCLFELNMPFEASYQLLQVIESKNAELLGPSLKKLIDVAPPHLEGQLAYSLLSVDEKIVPVEAQDKANYLKAKYLMRNNQPQEALRIAIKIKKTSDFYFKAQYVAAIAEYSLREEGKAISRQKALLTLMKKKNNDKDLLALTQLNLARVLFQRGQFKDAISSYNQISKDSPMWNEASTEQGWARLLDKDSVGAIQTIHSLQSSKMRMEFAPESYVIKSLGYINLCQFSEAYKALVTLEEDYKPWLTKLQVNEKKSDPDRLFKIVSKYQQSDSRKDVEGYPASVLKDMAENKDFQTAQEALKHLNDENAAYPFLKTLIAKDKKSLAIRKKESQQRVTDLTNKIATSGPNPKANKNLDSWRFQLQYTADFLKTYDQTLALMNEGEVGLTKFASASTASLEQKKAQWRKRAGLILQGHQTNLANHLKQLFEVNENLKSEIYNRNDESLRIRLANKANRKSEKADRAPASDFSNFQNRSSEFEKVNFKSTLKNKCY